MLSKKKRTFAFDMTLKQYISRLQADSGTIFIALSWVLFMCFFTYTDLFMASISLNDSFSNAFHKMHVTSVSLLVNLGLVFMLLFDYTSKKSSVPKILVWFVVGGVITSILIFLHCLTVQSGENVNLIQPLSWHNFSIVLFVIFLMTVFILKTFSEFSSTVTVQDRQTQNNRSTKWLLLYQL